MAAATRIYKVEGADDRFLVRASNPAQARGHVVRNLYKASVPSQDELVQLIQAGVVVEELAKESAS